MKMNIHGEESFDEVDSVSNIETFDIPVDYFLLLPVQLLIQSLRIIVGLPAMALCRK